MASTDSTEHDYFVTYEVKVRQPYDPANYGHLDGDLTPQLMAESDVDAYQNGGMMLEELLQSLDGETEIKVTKVEAVPDEE